MKKFVNKRILLAVVTFLTVWAITGGIAYGATVYTKSLRASGNIVAEGSFSFYSDPGATQLITDIVFPDVEPGESSTFTVYLKNTSSVTEIISVGTNTVSSSIGTLTLTFDGQTQKTLAPGAICTVVGTLNVSENASPGPINFTFSVQAIPSSNTTTPPPTQTVNGQQVFSTYCGSCHSGPPSTSRTQAQLLSFIPTHRTGSSLTAEQVATVAAYIKP